MKKKISPLFKLLKKLLKLFYPKIKFYGTDNIPQQPVIFVGNHSQMAGPIICELFFPVKRYTWCAGEMMKLKEVPSYAYKDFWSQKPKYSRPFYRILSFIIAPLSVFLFNNANAVAVYKNSNGLSTFKNTVKLLSNGYSIVIFPENDKPYNNIIYDFQDKFIDVAKLYYKRCKKEISFVPMYIAPNLREVHFGKSISYCISCETQQQREIIKNHLMNEITTVAKNLPEHTVVPYRNIPKKLYPSNVPIKEDNYEKKHG